MRILYVLPTLNYSGSARQALLLGPRLKQLGCEVHVCWLGQAGPWAEALQNAGVMVHPLPWTRAFDPTPLWRLHQLLKGLASDVIHVWHTKALRTLALVGKRYLPRTVVSRPLNSQGLGRLDRWLLRRVKAIVANGPWEAQQCLAQGLPVERVVVVPPGVERGCVIAPCTVHPRGAYATPLSWPEGRRVVCLGPLEPRKGFRDAIWAIDMLAFVFPDLHLLVAGTGPEEPTLRHFAGHIRNLDNVHFLGPIDHPAELLAQADLCWVPSLAAGGQTVALEAQAVGCPVIASDVPALREVVKEGAGFLFPPGDKVALGRCTRALLKDENLRQRLSGAAKTLVRQMYPAEAFVQRTRQLYV